LNGADAIQRATKVEARVRWREHARFATKQRKSVMDRAPPGGVSPRSCHKLPE
jgi:hypothetical protein